MKITKTQLKKIIEKELAGVLKEEQEEEQEPVFGKERVGASDMRKVGVAQGKEAAAASGLTAQERPVIKQLNDLIIKAANKGNITTGKTGKLIKLLAVELQKIITS